jgi:hypothetical protein
MQTEPTHPNREPAPRTWRAIAVQFLLGLGAGCLLIMIPLSYFWYFTPVAVHAIHIIGAVGFVLVCGSFSAVLGGQFVSFLSKLIESLPAV